MHTGAVKQRIRLQFLSPSTNIYTMNNESNSKYIPQGEAVMRAVQAVLKSKNVAESIQHMLNYIAEHEGYAVYESSTTYMRKILDLVCEAIEPEQAIL